MSIDAHKSIRKSVFICAHLWMCLFSSSPATAADQRTILLVAGPKDPNHPAGTHEYEQSARLLKYALESSPNLRGVRPVVVTGGWPHDPALLSEAAAIVLLTSGADRNPLDHPLLAGDRLPMLEKEMRRGCGLVAIHWTVFVPNADAGEKFLEWIGGHFDYQSGPAPRRWAGDIRDLTTTVTPGSATHPIVRGVEPFRVRDEFYFGLRFRPNDRRLVPVLRAEIPQAGEQTVGWAVERDDGGRGFGFTGGHYFANWRVPGFRRAILNAIAWTAKLDVPAGGVDSTIPAGDVPAGDPAWTPRLGPGQTQPWEMAGEKDWQDGRLRVMDTGPTFNATMKYAATAGPVWTYKGLAIKVGDGGVLFDRARLRFVTGWTGGWLQHSDSRFGLLNTPVIAGTPVFTSDDWPGWAGPKGDWKPPTPGAAPLPRDWGRYRGMYLHGSRVVIAYTVGDVAVLESPGTETGDGGPILTRSLEIGPTSKPLTLFVCRLPPGQVANERLNGVPVASVPQGDTRAAVAIQATGIDALWVDASGHVTVVIPPSESLRRIALHYWRGPGADLAKFAGRVKSSAAPADLAAITKPGPPRWGPPLETRGQLGADDGPLALDTLTVPYDNPHRALMFLTGVDFLPNGDAAVCTAHGDVWIVSGIDASLQKLKWKRFATGLYQPLGLKVVDGNIHVVERGQVTRLHDNNADGEADFYENVNNDWHTGSGEHSYDTGLEADSQGNFWLFKTGDTDTPTGGCLLRVPRDGSPAEVFATGFRHPIGIGLSPTGVLSGADQEGNYMPATRIDFFRRGGFYGDMRAHHRSKPPTSFDPPLVWLPREADSSAGGQAWVPAGHWGPLGGECLHFSWGRCRLLHLFTEQVGDVRQGAAVDLGLFFLSGPRCGRFRNEDGHLYVTGLNGWQTAARRDGCLQRVRATGQPFRTLTGWATRPSGVRLTFSTPLDRAAAADPARWTVSAWNYRWSADYGSRHWSPGNPHRQGEDAWPVDRVDVSADGKSVDLAIRGWRPVMSVRLKYALPAAEGPPLAGTVWGTVHALPR